VVAWDAPVIDAVNVNDVLAPDANAPIILHKLAAGTVAQSVPVLAVNDRSLANESRITKLLASDWPVLVAVIVYWTVSPVSRALGSLPVTLDTYLLS
jgi:hypothetical protein